MGTQLPSPKGHSPPPNLRPISVVAKWLGGLGCHMIWRKTSAQATLCWMKTQLPLPKKGAEPPIIGPCLLWPNGWMDQDGTWHGDGPRSMPHYARWGPRSPPSKRGQNPLPIFGPFLLWSNGWMHQDVAWYGGRPQSRRLCVRWGPSCPPLKGHSPQFSANARCG